MAARKRRMRELATIVSIQALGIDSQYEPVTRTACAYRDRHVYPYLQSKGFAVRRFQGPLARRIYVAPEARKAGVAYLTGVGHGLPDLFSGEHGDVIFRVGNYQPNEAAGKIVHFLSCQTARELGPDFVRNGCCAYIDYDEDFVFSMAESDVFFECDSDIDRALADGLTVAAAVVRVRKLFDKRIAHLRAVGKFYVAAMLEFNRDHLRSPVDGAMWGDPRAQLP